MSEDQDEVEGEPPAAGDDSGVAHEWAPAGKALADQLAGSAVDRAWKFDDWMGSSPGVRAAMNALAGPSRGVGAGGLLGGEHAAWLSEGLIGRHAALGFDPTGVGRSFDVSKLGGVSTELESVSARVSAAAKAWMTLDSVRSSPLFDATELARSFDVGKLTGLEAVSDQVSAAAKAWMTSVGGEASSGLSAAAQTAAQLLAGSHLGEVGLSARYAMNWANGELGRHLHSLTGLVGAGSAMAGHMSTFEKLMRESQRSMHEAIGRWAGPGHLVAMDQLMRQTHQSLAETMGRWSMPEPAAWMNEMMHGPAESITAMMRSWSTLAEGGHWAARLALRMALAAKDAVKRGDRAAVKRFMLRWLGFKFVSWDLVNSASLVLLDVRTWLPDDLLALDYDPCPKLRALTLAEHRKIRRLIIDPELQAHGKPVLSLDKPVGSEGSTTPLLELVAAKPEPEPAEDDISDPRVLEVFDKLTDRECRIFRERGRARNWVEAALACGEDPEVGERLRRKVKRLGGLIGVQAASGDCEQSGGEQRPASTTQVVS